MPCAQLQSAVLVSRPAHGTHLQKSSTRVMTVEMLKSGSRNRLSRRWPNGGIGATSAMSVRLANFLTRICVKSNGIGQGWKSCVATDLKTQRCCKGMQAYASLDAGLPTGNGHTQLATQTPEGVKRHAKFGVRLFRTQTSHCRCSRTMHLPDVRPKTTTPEHPVAALRKGQRLRQLFRTVNLQHPRRRCYFWPGEGCICIATGKRGQRAATCCVWTTSATRGRPYVRWGSVQAGRKGMPACVPIAA